MTAGKLAEVLGYGCALLLLGKADHHFSVKTLNAPSSQQLRHGCAFCHCFGGISAGKVGLRGMEVFIEVFPARFERIDLQPLSWSPQRFATQLLVLASCDLRG